MISYLLEGAYQPGVIGLKNVILFCSLLVCLFGYLFIASQGCGVGPENLTELFLYTSSTFLYLLTLGPVMKASDLSCLEFRDTLGMA